MACGAPVEPPPQRGGGARRLPLLTTLVVALAVATMIALGVWQLERRGEKEALIARYRANQQAAPIALPRFLHDRTLLFRRASAFCLQPTSWETRGAPGGGWRHLAHCRTGAEGPGFVVDIGTGRDPHLKPRWGGGPVSGILTEAPSSRSWIEALAAPIPPTPMIIAERALPGLTPSRTPDPRDLPNNHLAYAVQWFFFAGAALVIYALALRQRAREAN